MTKAAKQTLVEDAYQRLRLAILNNELPAGTQMPEPEIALRLGMSRTPAHEALLRLEAEGLVKMIPRRGARVLAISPDDMREIYELLTVLESRAAYCLAEGRPSRKQLKTLEQVTIDMEQALQRKDLDAWADADNRFHREVLLLHGNTRLIGVVKTLCYQAHRARMLTLRYREFPSQSTREHREIFDAIAAGDADRAAQTFTRHRQRAAEELLQILEDLRVPGV